MRLLKKLFRLYVFCSVHVGLVAGSLVLVSFIQMGLEVNCQLFFFVSFSTIFAYNIIKYGPGLNRNLGLLQKVRPALLLINTVAGGVAFLLSFFVLRSSWLILLPAVVLSFLYAFPLRGERTLRSLGWVKILIVSLVWAMVTVLLPWYEARQSLELVVWPFFLQRLLAVMVLTIPFEIRDMDQDDCTLGTLPQRLGIRGVKIFGTILVASYLLVGLSGPAAQPCEQLVSIIFIITCGGLMWGATKTRDPYYTAFWVESVPVFWLLLLMFCELS